MDGPGPFNDNERAALHSLAEIFRDRESRDELRRLLDEGATLREIIFAYRANRRIILMLKTAGGLILIASGVVAALKSLGLWPK